MRIDVTNETLEKVNAVADVLHKHFPDAEISIKQRLGKITILIKEARPG